MNFDYCLLTDFSGAVVQLGERLTGSQKVTGSSPVGSTKLRQDKESLHLTKRRDSFVKRPPSGYLKVLTAKLEPLGEKEYDELGSWSKAFDSKML